jgi:hypothetical protein
LPLLLLRGKKSAMNTHISKGALLQRINGLLAQKNEMVRKTKHGKWHDELGDYYIIDYNQNVVVEKHVDLLKKGKELGVIN